MVSLVFAFVVSHSLNISLACFTRPLVLLVRTGDCLLTSTYLHTNIPTCLGRQLTAAWPRCSAADSRATSSSRTENPRPRSKKGKSSERQREARRGKTLKAHVVYAHVPVAMCPAGETRITHAMQTGHLRPPPPKSPPPLFSRSLTLPHAPSPPSPPSAFSLLLPFFLFSSGQGPSGKER